MLGIVGPACTEASLLLANLTQQNRYGIIQALMATSDVFDDHKRYRHTFGMVSSFNILVGELLKIAKMKQWTNIGVLYDQSREFFVRTFDSFVRQAREENVNFTSWSILTPDYLDSSLNDLKNNHRTRIIFAIMSAKTARHVACLAEKKGLTFPKYQFVYADRRLSNFLGETDFNFTDIQSYICDKESILKGLNGSLLLQYGLNSISSDTYLNETAKLTVGEVKDQYNKKLKEYGDEIGESLTNSSYAYPYYDATWALALSIHRTIEKMGSFPQSNLAFLNNSEEAEMLRTEFEALSFQGVSVRVKFDNRTGHVISEINISQVKFIDKEIATVDQNITYIDDDFMVSYVTLHAALVGVGMVLTVTALLLSILLHFVNIYYRNSGTMKASSPRLNQLIFLSCYLIILCVFLQTIHYGFIKDLSLIPVKITAEFICNLQAFLFPLSLSLIISTVFIKLWRLYSIFNRAFKKQLLIFDRQLALVIVGMQVCVILLSIPWLATDRFRLRHADTFNEEDLIQYTEATCYTDNEWAALPLVFVLIVATLSFWLAYLNRKIRQNQYRSKDTIVFTYLFCLLLGVLETLFILSYLLRLDINVSYILYSLSYLSVVFLCNFVLFVPLFYSVLVRKHPPTGKRKRTLILPGTMQY